MAARSIPPSRHIEVCPRPRNHSRRAAHAALGTAPHASRGEVLPERVPVEGLPILRDGDPSDPEATLSPSRYYDEHRAKIEGVVAPRRPAALTAATAAAREARSRRTATWSFRRSPARLSEERVRQPDDDRQRPGHARVPLWLVNVAVDGDRVRDAGRAALRRGHRSRRRSRQLTDAAVGVAYRHRRSDRSG